MKRKLSLLFLIFFSAVASAYKDSPSPPTTTCSNTVCQGISGSEDTCENTSGYCYWMGGNSPIQCNDKCISCKSDCTIS